MKLQIKLKFAHNGYINKNGEGKIWIGFKFPYVSEWTWRSSGVFVEPKYWNETENYISRKHPKYGLYDAIITRIRNDIEQMEYDAIVNNKPFQQSHIDKYLKRGSESDIKSFNDYCLAELDKDRELRPSTRLSIERSIKYHFNDFDPDVGFSEMDFKKAKEYKTYLYDKGLSHNTVAKEIKNIKRFISQAIAEGKMTTNPFFKKSNVSFKRTKFDFLRPGEIKALEDVEVPEGSTLWRTKVRFLVACYTGLRHSDINQFTSRLHIRNTDDGRKLLHLYTIKTDEPVWFPLDDFFEGRGRRIIEKSVTQGGKLPRNTNSDDNFNLKVLAKEMKPKLDRHISFHLSRHTFCTHIARETQSPFKVMQYTGIQKWETINNYIHLSEKGWY